MEGETIQKILGLLSASRCPDIHCDGKGTTSDLVQTVTPECCGNTDEYGGCCNNPIPKQDFEQVAAPCQWCHERDGVLKEWKPDDPLKPLN